jgi:predicted nucleic acid-binding protein
MTAALDTNVLVALLSGSGALSDTVSDVLERLGQTGALVICPVVYSEVLAGPGRMPSVIEDLLSVAKIQITWEILPSVWRVAGQSFARYAERRRQSSGGTPRRIIADFLIGAHASEIGTLVTLDSDFFQTNFPDLNVIAV